MPEGWDRTTHVDGSMQRLDFQLASTDRLCSVASGQLHSTRAPE